MNPGVRVRAVAVLTLGALALAGCGQAAPQDGGDGAQTGASAASSDGGTVKIATGVDVQTKVLAHLYQQRLQADGVKASVVDVGSSREQIMDALQDGRATMVPDFSGDLYVYARQHETPATPQPSASGSPAASATPTASSDAPRGLLDSLGQFLGITGETGPSDDDVYRALPDVLPRGIRLLDSSGAQRTDRMVVTAVTGAKYSLGDLNSVGTHCGQLSVGMPTGYAASAQGERGLKAYYDCTPRATPEYGSTGELVDALLSDGVQAAVLPSTDPAIEDDGLVALDDPDRLFRPERAVVIGSDSLSDDAAATVNAVSADLTSEDLTTITRLAGGSSPAMTPEKAATYVREQPR